MKKLYSAIVLCIFPASLLVSCSTSYHTAGGTKLTGNWILNNISLEDIDTATSSSVPVGDISSQATVTTLSSVQASAFNDVPLSCLNGSQWSLPSNGNGSYTINAGNGCAAGARKIVWSVQTINNTPYFQFKRIEGSVKAQYVKEGYRLELTSVSSAAMTMQATVSAGGKVGYIIYSFTRQ